MSQLADFWKQYSLLLYKHNLIQSPREPRELGAATVISQMKKQRGEVTRPWSPSRRGAEPRFELRIFLPHLGRTEIYTTRIVAQIKTALGAVGTLGKGWPRKRLTGNTNKQGLKGRKAWTGGEEDSPGKGPEWGKSRPTQASCPRSGSQLHPPG